MIEVTGVNKMFGEIKALDNIVATIQEGSIFGLIGTNGAGKSTLLRVISGVLKPDTGMALIDGENVYENPQAKAKIFFLPDNAYFFQNATAKTMAEYYQVIYPQFDMERFREMVSGFGLEFTRKLSTFSKGMKRQVLRKCMTRRFPIHGYREHPDLTNHLYVYGSDMPAIAELMRQGYDTKLVEGLDYTEAEVVWAVREEMARTVEDVLARRVRILFVDARRAVQAAPRVAQLLAAELGYDEVWERAQVEQFTRLAEHYYPSV